MTTAAQTANDVHDVMYAIARCDFRTGFYGYTTANKDEVTWVGFAQHGDGYRFFTIHDANTDQPMLRVLSKDQSMMHVPGEIGEVDATDIDYEVALTDLTANTFTGVVRLLGLKHLADESQRIRKKAEVARLSANREAAG